MPYTPHHQKSADRPHLTPSAARRFLLGTAALTTLMAITVGAPILLVFAWHHIGPPIPSVRQMTGPDNGSVFVRSLGLVGWIAWSTMTWAITAEVAALWRGWRLPALRWQQRMIAGLVASVSLMLSTPAIASTIATPANAAVLSRSAPVTPSTGSSSQQTEPLAPAVVVHQVARGEQLPQIAEHYYGDQYAWPRIAVANYDRPQPDGRSLQPGATRVYPGWRLTIPAPMVLAADTSITANAVVADRTSASNIVYTVRHGDWLWYIADRYLGNPDRYSEIVALNPGYFTTHAPGHIEVGWTLVLPHDAHDTGIRAHATGTTQTPASTTTTTTPRSDGTSPAPNGNGPSPSSAPTAVPTASPSHTPGETAATSPSAMPSVAPSPHATGPDVPSTTATMTQADTTGSDEPMLPTTPASATNAADSPALAAAPRAPGNALTSTAPSSGDQTAAVGGLVGAGILAALALVTLRRSRRRQQQHRRPGRRLPQPLRTSEAALLAAAEPLDIDRIDGALRTLAGQLAGTPQEDLPDIIGVWVTDGTVQLHLAQPCPRAPHSWLAGHTTWTLLPSEGLPDSDGQIAPLPALVTVGSRPGRHLLLDLERLGHLHLDGDADLTHDLLRYLIAELACNTWSDDVEVVLAGLGSREAELLVALNPDRVHIGSSLTDAIERARHQVEAAETTLHNLGARSSFTGRIADLAGDTWMPQILIAANPDPRDLPPLRRLSAELTASRACGVALLTVGQVGDASGPRITVSADGLIDVVAGRFTADAVAAGLPISELEPLAHILQNARDATDEPVPPASESEPWAFGTDAAGALLYPPESEGSTGRHTETATELASAERCGTTTALAAELNPHPEVDVESMPSCAGTWADHSATVVPLTRSTTGTPGSAPTAPKQLRLIDRPTQRRHEDSRLDRDLQAWQEQEPGLVHVGILGPVAVTAPGQEPTERRLFLSEVIVYLAQRGVRGATADQITDALWPDGNVKEATRRVSLTRARRWLGNRPDGQPWLPDMAADRTYRLADGYSLDWHLFRRLRSRAQTRGTDGIEDLRAALDLVRGAPLEAADRAYAVSTRNPYTWLPDSDIYPPHLISAIVDTAHDLAAHSFEAGDSATARWAVEQAWQADPYRGDDSLWLDMMHAALADGHQRELTDLFFQLMEARDAEVPEDLNRSTYAWIHANASALLHGPALPGGQRLVVKEPRV